MPSPPAAGVNLSRRGFLRGTGAALALPWLASWPGLGRAAAAATPPRRAAFLYFPNGAPMKHWVPEAAGAEFTLPGALEPLAAIREHATRLPKVCTCQCMASTGSVPPWHNTGCMLDIRAKLIAALIDDEQEEQSNA